MLGKDLLNWFELFDGIVIYRPCPGGGHQDTGWINWSDIENRFKSEKLLFDGQPYEPSNQEQRELLLNAIIRYAGDLVVCSLLERRRQISPPSLDYRLTRLGRRVGNWGYGENPGFKKRLLFFLIALGFKIYKVRKIIAIGGIGLSVMNAVKFYSTAWSWAESLPFAAWSTAIVTALIAIWAIIKNRLGGKD